MACMKILAVGTGVGSLGGSSSEDSSGCGVPRWLPLRYSLLGRDKFVSDFWRPVNKKANPCSIRCFYFDIDLQLKC